MKTALEDHTVLLIGANGGIGGAIAHKLGHEGAHIFLAARDKL
jgi:NADP-dependent 3-hydroxy acid dehydrogenase YdfG